MQSVEQGLLVFTIGIILLGQRYPHFWQAFINRQSELCFNTAPHLVSRLRFTLLEMKKNYPPAAPQEARS